MGSSQSTKALDSVVHRRENCAVSDKLHAASFRAPSRSYYFDVSPPFVPNPRDIHVASEREEFNKDHGRRVSAVIIFDLDDTLIPTEWIRSSFAARKFKFQTAEEVYEAIKVDINRRTANDLTPSILSTLRRAKKWCETVAIVTNARSVKWLSAIKFLFPEVVQLLEEERIPIVRSCPGGEGPSIHEETAYFSYWMNAKKAKFLEIVRRHCEDKGSAGAAVDLVSIGDNDFEEYAALRAAQEFPEVRFAKVVRCRSGLSPESFLSQLNDIRLAIDRVIEEAIPCVTKAVGATVTYKIQ